MYFQGKLNNNKHGNTPFTQFLHIMYEPIYNHTNINHKPERTVRKKMASIWEEWFKSQPG